MTNIAFAPAAGYSAESCGVIAVGDGSLDVRSELDKNDGVIVVPEHDTALVARLDDYVALKRVSVRKAPDEPVVTDRFEAMALDELRDVAKNEFGIEKPGRSRDDVLAAVRAAANPDNGNA
jgi:hypothetical protein